MYHVHVRRVLYILILALLLPVVVQADDERERPHLSRGDRIAVVVTSDDPLRGFDRIALEERLLARGGRSWKVEKCTPLPVQTRDLTLYRADLDAALTAEEERLLKAGWTPLVEVPLAGQGAELFGVPVFADVADGRLTLVRPDHDRRVTVGAARFVPVELSHERVARRKLTTVTGLWLTADGRWLLATVRTNAPDHAETPPLERVFAVPLPRVLKRLRIDPKARGDAG